MYSKKGVFSYKVQNVYKFIEKKNVLKLYFKKNLITEKKIIFQGKINSRRKYYDSSINITRLHTSCIWRFDDYFSIAKHVATWPD